MLRRPHVLALPCLFFLFAAGSPQTPIFREIPAADSGITWVHENGRSDHRYLPETIGAGVAIFDYNNDGRMDVLLVNSGPSTFYRPSTPLQSALYRNNRDGTFTDVAKEAGVTTAIYGMGVATGDYDGDGYQDIFLSGMGKCVLYRNNGSGTFTDVTQGSGILASQWGTSAVWFDYDGDGMLDLFVGEFADYANKRVCGANDAYGGAAPNTSMDQTYYCNPKILKPAPSHLYRNLGNGKFADVSQRTGILSRQGKAWGAVAADINGDGFPDLFVSNDTMPNFLWLNQRGKTFEETGVEAGVGYSSEGLARSGMGVDAADFDRDGREDLIVANIDTQTTSVYRNSGHEVFDDFKDKTGVGSITRMLSGWGLRFFDYDNDGWLDLILSNGHPDDLVEQRNGGIQYRQPIILLHSIAGTTLENVVDSAGSAFMGRYSARGLEVGDFNNDGYPDVVMTENGGPVHLLMNNAQGGSNWLGLNLVAKIANPNAAGAILRWSIGGKIFSRQKAAGGSFLSSRDPREIIGAGKARIDWVEVRWPLPSHRVDRVSHPEMNRYLVITEGQTGAANN
jgi:enediyne biosynthesis protein E4